MIGFGITKKCLKMNNTKLTTAERFLCRYYDCEINMLQEYINRNHSLETMNKILKKYRATKLYDSKIINNNVE